MGGPAITGRELVVRTDREVVELVEYEVVELFECEVGALLELQLEVAVVTEQEALKPERKAVD